MSRALTFLAGAATGAAAAYFLDPQGGARRRAETKDKTVSSGKSVVSSAASQATAQASKVAGRAQSAVRSATPGDADHDDVTLARKVETEIFRAADAPKGQVSVNAENGVVFLRGELEDASWIERLGSAAEQVDGVKAVRNLLHPSGSPAPSAPGSS
jgi:osmotically-inducible protein OsmY